MPLSLSPSLLMSSASSVAFSPLSLFASGEQGAWYDPSDLSTMFQDTAGTTPVTATGQTVGLLLDKSKGLVLGPELVTNGDFSGGSTGWTLGANWSVSSGVASKTAGGANNLSQSVGIVNGRFYRISFVLTISGGTVWVNVGSSNSFSNAQTVGGTINLIVAANGTTGAIEFQAGSGAVATIDNISVKELPGNHATQATAASRPIYQVDGNGKAYLLFDGTDDFLLTGTITPGIDKAQVFTGVRKLSDAALGMVVEASTSIGSNNGTVAVYAPTSGGTATYQWLTRGTGLSAAPSPANYASPITNVLTGIGDIAADTAILRVNGTQVATSAADQGTGNYLAYPLYIGRRGGTTLPYNGRIYGLAVRFGANLSAAQISQMETWLNARTGAF